MTFHHTKETVEIGSGKKLAKSCETFTHIRPFLFVVLRAARMPFIVLTAKVFRSYQTLWSMGFVKMLTMSVFLTRKS